MERKYMGYKKKFIITDISFYLEIMLILLFILSNYIWFFIAVIMLIFEDISIAKIIFAFIIQAWLSIVIFIIIFKLKKFYYYEMVKMHMKEKYNFSVSDEVVEILSKNGKNVQVLTSDIEKIYINKYCSPLKSFFKFSCKMYMMGGQMDSNFCKDITCIRMKLKSDIENENYKKRGIYYNLFNYIKKFGTDDIYLCVYEIMYDETSDRNIEYLKDMYKGLID